MKRPSLAVPLASAILLLTAALLAAACTPSAGGGTSPFESAAEPALESAPSAETGDGADRSEPTAPSAAVSEPEESAGEDLEMSWEEVEALEAEQKFEAAFEAVGQILDRARRRGDEENWTRALVRRVQLRSALHGYETAVHIFREEEWPTATRWRSILDLFYAEGLVRYLEAYSWEIRQREAVESEGEVDLDAWTVEQIAAEADDAFARIWRRRAEWGSRGPGELSRYLERNDYPERIRGTLRDTVTYLWVEFLADTSLWSPEENNRVSRLPLGELLERRGAAGAEAAGEGIPPADAHPLVRMTALLADLESWHRQADRTEAAFEARLERLRRLWNAFEHQEDRATIRAHLESRLERLDPELEWWSMGQAELARMVEQEDTPDALRRAHRIAELGRARHPDSIGGRRCRHIQASIEAPSYSLTAMRLDGAQRRSIAVDHRNLARLHFRAYPADLRRQVEESEDYSLMPADQEVQRMVNGGPPSQQWTVDLPATPDYREHRTFVTPPFEDPGLYVVVASASPDFARDGNHMVAVNLVISDLVILSRPDGRSLEVAIRSGADGDPVADARVSLYRFDYQHGHGRRQNTTTAADGRALFELGPRDRFFLLAEKGHDVSVDTTAHYGRSRAEPRVQDQALVYTDRSIYRPLQEIFWKVVAYRGAEASYRTLPHESLQVELVDANGEVVAKALTTTNDFGSASGSFDIPAGRLLGRWWLRTSIGGGAGIRVEEYKRPTFEVEIAEPEGSLRLNRKAELTGEARYYFGLPVVEGDVEWRVTREPIYPRWWSWFYPPAPSSAERVAGGEAELDESGVFRIAFTPEADERQAGSGVTYRYRLSADVTETGGETRSAERVFTLGFVSVRASLEAERGFFRRGQSPAFDLHRTDLDGSPRAGAAHWSVRRLQEPQSALLPAEQPLPEPPGEGAGTFRTPGDRQRPRWETGVDPQRVLRGWSAGEEVAAGDLEHDEMGEARLELPVLAPGAYRLSYRTTDPFGADFHEVTDFLVVAEASASPALPLALMVESRTVPVGGTARLLVASGLADQEMELELFAGGERGRRWQLESSAGVQVIEIPINPELRGGFGIRLSALRDHQLMRLESSLFVPWSDRRLSVEFETFRDRLRPGQRETWRVAVRGDDEEALAAGSTELLAYMYDRSLDFFAPHRPPDPFGLYPSRVGFEPLGSNLGGAGAVWSRGRDFVSLPEYPSLSPDRLLFLDGYGVGGMARQRMYAMAMPSPPPASMPMEERAMAKMDTVAAASPLADQEGGELREETVAVEPEPADAPLEVRSDFSETAFWKPHLLLDEDGAVAFEFQVPDSVTEWSVWVHALTEDLRSGRLEKRSRSVKELMVRPSLPRFLREGDRAELRVVVNNAGDADLEGRIDFAILDPESEADLSQEFGLSVADARDVPFAVERGGSATLSFPVRVPPRVGEIAFRVTATAGAFSDGEQRALPVLPGRMHLAQSRFATLSDEARRELHFADLAADDDPSRIDERLVVTLDTQLFYSVLQALPYLVDFPYECTEQTLNRFLSTGILASLFDRYPAVASMAEKFSQRDTRLETWEAQDPNRKMALVETPWLTHSRGGADGGLDLVRVLDPRIARAERRASLAKLEKAQTSLGGFPWWPGGPPSPYMTLYLLAGFSRALEFDVEVPRDMVQDAWSYMHRHYLDELLRDAIGKDCCWQSVTFLNYVLSSYPDDSWTGGVFTAGERRKMLDFSFSHWTEHSPLLKAYLALTLERAGRDEDATLVFDSIMDSARTTEDQGTFWAPEDRGWLWYNDRIETHAFALRALTELDPDDARRHGLVQWLLINKKLNHWKSTRATAEVIYALTHYLEREGTLAVREEVDVSIGDRTETFVFEPDEYTGRNNQVILTGDEIDPATSSTIVVEKETPGFAFASATWHFSTEKLPEEARGDFFAVQRAYFRRVSDGDGWRLQPLDEGARLEVGDQVEVQLAIRSKHAAEYVHLRDPRPAGFEPETLTSSFKWDLGLGYYEEVRDSGANFFFEWLPVGEYTFKYRLRANVAGTFRAAPATLQSMYAPEFTAYSAGDELTIAP